MGTIVMNMCGGEVEHMVPATAEYADEIQNAGWNPVVALQHALPYETRAAMPAELAAVDAELFLKKMYGDLS